MLFISTCVVVAHPFIIVRHPEILRFAFMSTLGLIKMEGENRASSSSSPIWDQIKQLDRASTLENLYEQI